jgi:hypothetical protein
MRTKQELDHDTYRTDHNFTEKTRIDMNPNDLKRGGCPDSICMNNGKNIQNIFGAIL